MIAILPNENLNKIFNKLKMLLTLQFGHQNICLVINALLRLNSKISKLCSSLDWVKTEICNNKHIKIDMMTITRTMNTKETKIVESKVGYRLKNRSPTLKNLSLNLVTNLFKAYNEAKIVNNHFKKINRNLHHSTLMK
jgi:hypothetical protein